MIKSVCLLQIVLKQLFSLKKTYLRRFCTGRCTKGVDQCLKKPFKEVTLRRLEAAIVGFFVKKVFLEMSKVSQEALVMESHFNKAVSPEAWNFIEKTQTPGVFL